MPDSPQDADVLRVLCLHTATQAPLGADTWIHVQIIRALDRGTHEVHVACRERVADTPTPTFLALREVPDVRLQDVNLGTEIASRARWKRIGAVVEIVPAAAAVARLAMYVRRHRIRVIHTSDRPRDAAVAVILGMLTGAKSIIHVHVAYNPAWMGRLLRWSLGKADALVGVSRFVAGTLVAGGQGAARVHVVLNAIDLPRWDPHVDGAGVRRELAIPDAASVVTTICRLFPEKGPAHLIRAIADVRVLGHDVHVLVVGQPMHPAYGQDLVNLVEELGLTGYAHFLDRRDDVPAVLAATDVFAMPSHREPFGLVFCEAMAMHLPVVAVADGGTVEVVEHGRTGLLSNYGDHEQLVADLSRLLGDGPLRAELGRAGRARVAAHFDIPRMASDVATVYGEVAWAQSAADG